MKPESHIIKCLCFYPLRETVSQSNEQRAIMLNFPPWAGGGWGRVGGHGKKEPKSKYFSYQEKSDSNNQVEMHTEEREISLRKHNGH